MQVDLYNGRKMVDIVVGLGSVLGRVSPLDMKCECVCVCVASVHDMADVLGLSRSASSQLQHLLQRSSAHLLQ